MRELRVYTVRKVEVSADGFHAKVTAEWRSSDPASPNSKAPVSIELLRQDPTLLAGDLVTLERLEGTTHLVFLPQTPPLEAEKALPGGPGEGSCRMNEGAFPGDPGYGLEIRPEDPLPQQALDALDLVNRKEAPQGPQDEGDDFVAFPPG